MKMTYLESGGGQVTVSVSGDSGSPSVLYYSCKCDQGSEIKLFLGDLNQIKFTYIKVKTVEITIFWKLIFIFLLGSSVR